MRTDATDSHKHLYANSQASSRREKARRPWRRGFAPRPGEDGVRITVRSVDGIPFTVWGGDDPGHPIQNGANNQVRNRWAERRPNYLSPLVTQAVREDERPAAARRRRLATTERKGCPRARPLGEVFFSAPGGCARVLRLIAVRIAAHTYDSRRAASELLASRRHQRPSECGMASPRTRLGPPGACMIGYWLERV